MELRSCPPPPPGRHGKPLIETDCSLCHAFPEPAMHPSKAGLLIAAVSFQINV